MKYIFIVLFFLPFLSFGQANCTAAYFHRNIILDKLPVPDYIQKSTDSVRIVSNGQLENTKKALVDSFATLYQKLKAKKKLKPNADFRNSKAFKKMMKQAQIDADERVVNAKRKLMRKFYAEKMKNASLEVYDKGKQYKYVFDADSGSYKITPETCDETDRVLKLVLDAK